MARRPRYLAPAMTEGMFPSEGLRGTTVVADLRDAFPMRAPIVVPVRAHQRRHAPVRPYVRRLPTAAFPHSLVYPREGREAEAMAELRAERGNACEGCETTEGPLDFAHIVPTALSGRGRGIRQRAADIRRYPEAYRLWCDPCHRAHERSEQGAYARGERYSPEYEYVLG